MGNGRGDLTVSPQVVIGDVQSTCRHCAEDKPIEFEIECRVCGINEVTATVEEMLQHIGERIKCGICKRPTKTRVQVVLQ